jgi:hypothetical protein
MDVYEPYKLIANAVIANACKDYFGTLRKLRDYEDSDGKKLAELRKINDAIETAYANDMSGKTDTDFEWYQKQFRKVGKLVNRYHDLVTERQELEKFFQSEWFMLLARGGVDGKRLMNYMKEYEQNGAKTFNGKYEKGDYYS